ncbi:MAG: hypothetical protein HOA17_09490 [Candidatus Melainabacteria bacterium]|jgi:hypothetical protein|nr:hypothetical protein [Candidatus Melainabacteria bacterium]
MRTGHHSGVSNNEVETMPRAMHGTGSTVSRVPNGKPSGVFYTLSKAARHFLMLPTEVQRSEIAKFHQAV